MQDQGLRGRVVGHHELRERIGGGAMGDVYLALHLGLQQERAVKILAPDLACDPTYVELFAREARVAAGLRHPSIVQIHDVRTDQGFNYIVMELLEGLSLNRVLARRKLLSLADALPLLDQLAAALDYAHGRGVIHRDVKPSNVMVGSDGRLTLVDFGIARAAESTGMTRTRTSGTPYYMAPTPASQSIVPTPTLVASSNAAWAPAAPTTGPGVVPTPSRAPVVAVAPAPSATPPPPPTRVPPTSTPAPPTPRPDRRD